MKTKIWILILLSSLFGACGGSGSKNNSSSPDPEANISALGSVVHLTYEFSTQVAMADTVLSATFSESYSAPLYIKEDGQVTVRAREFPRMVLRVCPADSNLSACDVFLPAGQVGEGADIVFDLCGENRNHAECGAMDPTLFEGSLNAEGKMLISSVDVRIRIFLLGMGGPDGYSVSATDPGIMADLPRLIAVVQTDPEIVSGPLSGIGQRVSNQTVTLVGGGVIPEAMPELGGAPYFIKMSGTLDADPLSFLE